MKSNVRIIVEYWILFLVVALIASFISYKIDVAATSIEDRINESQRQNLENGAHIKEIQSLLESSYITWLTTP